MNRITPTYLTLMCVSDVFIQDATTNDPPPGLFDIKGYPTLYLYTATGEIIRYEGDRSKTDLTEFIKQNRTPGLKAAATAQEEVDTKDEL